MARNSDPQVGNDIINQITDGVAAWSGIGERYEALRLVCTETLAISLDYLIDEQVFHNVHNPKRPENESLLSKIRPDASRPILEGIVAERTLEELEAIRNGNAIVTLAKRITITPHTDKVRVIEFPNRRTSPISEQLATQNSARIYKVPEGRLYKGTLVEAHTLPMLGGAVLFSLGQRNTLLFGLVNKDLEPQVTIDVRTVKS